MIDPKTYQDWKKFRQPKQLGPGFRPKFLCCGCRLVLSRPFQGDPGTRVCPNCGGPALRVGRNFRPPRRADKAAWKVVIYLMDHGFRYGRYARHPIPQTMGAAKRYVIGLRPDMRWQSDRYF